jgi:hypothetical protein
MDRMNAKIVVAAACFVLFSTVHLASAAPNDDQSGSALSSLAGAAVSTTQLGEFRARGNVVVSSVDNGTVTNNSVSGNVTTGAITDDQSMNSNAGITTIFQNTGNNSLFQNSTAVYISLH